MNAVRPLLALAALWAATAVAAGEPGAGTTQVEAGTPRMGAGSAQPEPGAARSGRLRRQADEHETLVGRSACVEALLRRLGWRIEEAPGAAAAHAILPGTPCKRGSLVEAQAVGDLRLRLPAETEARARALEAALAHPATRCAYLFVLGDATRRAAHALETNPGYRFSALQLGWIGFGTGGARRQGWAGFRSFGRGYRPAGSNAAALEAFYSGRVRSECGVGRQVAQLATQRELYGDAGFDAEFAPGELSIGTFVGLHDTDSILLGRNAGEFFADGKAVRSAAMGRQAFMGAPGFIEHVFERIFLDDVHNQAENFVVTDVSAEAAEALARHGGFAHYDAVNRQVWEASRTLRRPWRKRFERLLYDRDPVLRAKLDADERTTLARMESLLDDPFYRGFEIYVHPMGVKPIGYHVIRLLDRNPRTPYAIELALHNLHTTLYRRWIEHELRQCGRRKDGAQSSSRSGSSRRSTSASVAAQSISSSEFRPAVARSRMPRWTSVRSSATT